MALADYSKVIKSCCSSDFVYEALSVVEQWLVYNSYFCMPFNSYYMARKARCCSSEKIVKFQGQYFVLSRVNYNLFRTFLSFISSACSNDSFVFSLESFLSVFNSIFHSDNDSSLAPSALVDIVESDFPF